MKWVTYQRGWQGRGWGGVLQDTVLRGEQSIQWEERKHIQHFTGGPGWSRGRRCDAALHRKKSPVCCQKQMIFFFWILKSSHFDLFPSTSFPFSCLSPPPTSSWSSHSFLSSAASKNRELTVLTSSVAWTICSRVKEQNKISYFMSLQCEKPTTFYSIQGDLKMHLFNKVKDRLVICEKAKNTLTPAPAA